MVQSLRLSMPHPSSDEILSHSITMLAAFKEACTAISIVPALPAVVGALLEILKTIENVKKDKEVCTKLRNRVIELGHELKEDFDKFRYVIDPSLDLQLVKMLLTLKTVQEDLEKLSNLRRVSRWIHQGTIKTKLEGHIETVDQMGHTYLRTIVSALATNALRQVTYTQDQHRYFRECELEWREKRHVVGQSIDNIFSEELIALWNGRAVVVRYLCEDHSTEDEVNNLITSFPSYRSPHMAQFLGRSHPGTKQAFIVLETGHIDLGRYLRTPGSVFDKLRCVFQMHVDWQDLLRFLKMNSFPLSTDGELHSHTSQCLASLSIKGRSTLLVSAEDVLHTNFFCLGYSLNRAMGYECQANPTDRTSWDIDFSAASRSVISILDCEAQSAPLECNIADPRKARLPRMWSFRSDTPHHMYANVGDYGYEHPQHHHFVRLGSVCDVIKDRGAVIREYVAFVDGAPENADHIDMSGEWVWRHLVEPDKLYVHELNCVLPRGHIASFWWLHARSVAELHDLPLDQLMVVSRMDNSSSIQIDAHSIDDEDRGTGPGDIFFHRLPPMANGQIPLPSGYWSLRAEPACDSRPDISSPGVHSSYRQEVQYTYLSPMQAEIVTCFSNYVPTKTTCSTFTQRMLLIAS